MHSHFDDSEFLMPMCILRGKPFYASDGISHATEFSYFNRHSVRFGFIWFGCSNTNESYTPNLHLEIFESFIIILLQQSMHLHLISISHMSIFRCDNE